MYELINLGEIMYVDQYMIIFKEYSEFRIYMIGGIDDNELIFVEAMETLNSSLDMMFKDGFEQTGIAQVLTVLLLIINELIDDG